MSSEIYLNLLFLTGGAHLLSHLVAVVFRARRLSFTLAQVVPVPRRLKHNKVSYIEDRFLGETNKN